jgi:D-alanyl-D-alanine carboxypeptidase
MQIQTHHSKLFFFLIICSFFLLLTYSIFTYSSQVFAQDDSGGSQVLENVSQVMKEKDGGTVKENIIAKAYVIYDINSKKIVRSQNASTPLPIASMTKVITVGTLLATAKQNNVQIRDETKYRIQKALVQSSNEDADSLGYIYSYSFGRELLPDANSLMSNLGINNITLTNLTGLDNYDGTASNIATPEAMAKAFAFMYENYRDVFEYTKFDEVESYGDTIVNTNQGTASTFGILASKTGFTYAAGGNLGVIVSPEPGKTYVIVVMHSTKEGRFSDMQKLVKLLPLILKESE